MSIKYPCRSITLIKLVLLGFMPSMFMPSGVFSQEIESPVDTVEMEEQDPSVPNPNIRSRTQPLPVKPVKNRTFDYFDDIPEGYQPESFDEESSEQFNTYRLDFGDIIGVTVQRFPEFSFSGSLDADGTVVVPVLGRISLKGLTIEEVETKISYELGQQFLQEPPQVIAVLLGERPVTLTMMGEVFKPGYYTVAQNTPMSVVLSLAGGTTDRADLRSIIVKRTLTDGSVMQERLDLYSPLVEGKKEPNLKLQAGDSVIVSRLEVGEDRDYDRSFIASTNVPQQAITVRIVAPNSVAGVQLRNIVLPNGSSFLDAVAQLPTFIPLVIKEEITLMRFDAELGKVVTQTLNVSQTIQDGDLAQNVSLRDQDVIIVSRTILGKFLAGIRVITQPIRDIFGFTNFISNAVDGNFTGGGGTGLNF